MSDITKPKQKDQEKVKVPSMYKVVYHNDNYTDAMFVLVSLMKVFGKSREEATAITEKIHNSNKVVVAKYTKDIAETKAKEVMDAAKRQGFPLKVTVEE